MVMSGTVGCFTTLALHYITTHPAYLSLLLPTILPNHALIKLPPFYFLFLFLFYFFVFSIDVPTSSFSSISKFCSVQKNAAIKIIYFFNGSFWFSALGLNKARRNISYMCSLQDILVKPLGCSPLSPLESQGI